MRLIDADNVIDILEFYLTEADGIHWALRDIKEQPTAYDVDKIVEQLEFLPSKKHSVMRESKEVPEWFETVSEYELIRRDKAIEIVKGGAV